MTFRRDLHLVRPTDDGTGKYRLGWLAMDGVMTARTARATKKQPFPKEFAAEVEAEMEEARHSF
jgi:hypothetical protein